MTAWKDKQYAGLVELADAVDSKSTEGNFVRVQVPHPAPVVSKFTRDALTPSTVQFRLSKYGGDEPNGEV